MAKLIIINSEKGENLETHEDVFKLSNLLAREIYVKSIPITTTILRNQTFYTIFDIDNVPTEKKAYDLYNTLFPTMIFKTSKDDYLFGSCKHVLDNVLHYSNDLFDPMVDNLTTYLPKKWKLSKEYTNDYPIGNDIIPYIFDSLNEKTVQNFIDSDERLENNIFKSNSTEEKKEIVFKEILGHVFEPAIEYDPQSYNYRISRREIGNLVRKQVFSIVSGTIHVIGPEMESIRDVVLKFYSASKRTNFVFYTIDTSKQTNYKNEQIRNKKEKLKFSQTLIAQRKNQNNFFKGLIHHLQTQGTPTSIIYIGSYPSYWLETIKWFPVNIHCYDPKWRKVDNDKIIWHSQIFTLDMVEYVQENSYVYIDIRTDIRNSSSKELELRKEDNLNIEIALKLAARKCTVMFKRKIFDGINVSYNDPLFHPNLLQLGREFYNLIQIDYTTKEYDQNVLYDKLLEARYNNVANYVFDGKPFTVESKVHENDTIVALYSLSNTINSIEIIEKVLKHNHFVTFPCFKDDGDWRNIQELKSSPFPEQKKQLEFSDWAINPKEFCKKYNTELISESVFLQIGNYRALVPDLYNHLISIRFTLPLFYSDRYFPHIGIRQPSIYKRDSYMTSRLSAYISRQLTHSVDLTNLQKNKFEGYSGHLIAIEINFNSLVYTMSPMRWLIRSKAQLKQKRQRDKFRIGSGEPHTKEEFENTYQYLRSNNLILTDFENLLLD
uniref:VP3 n=1 Tax=Bat rotavirus H TaxID=2169484 RepID=A0A2Z4EVK0_9REOV|nr:VP3 [Bat rotavirus H]